MILMIFWVSNCLASFKCTYMIGKTSFIPAANRDDLQKFDLVQGVNLQCRRGRRPNSQIYSQDSGIHGNKVTLVYQLKIKYRILFTEHFPEQVCEARFKGTILEASSAQLVRNFSSNLDSIHSELWAINKVQLQMRPRLLEIIQLTCVLFASLRSNEMG